MEISISRHKHCQQLCNMNWIRIQLRCFHIHRSIRITLGRGNNDFYVIECIYPNAKVKMLHLMAAFFGHGKVFPKGLIYTYVNICA